MVKILFICHGNICRSAAAKVVFRQMLSQHRIQGIEADSAAATREEIGNDIYPPMKRALTAKGYECGSHAARQTTRADYARYDYLIGMDWENLTDMRRIYGGDPEGKISLLRDWNGEKGMEIDDPWYTRDFQGVLKQIEDGCQGILQVLTEKPAGKGSLLFFDIDGTLIDDYHQLVPSVQPAMEQARRNGHQMIINTGRTLCNQDSRMDALPLDGWIMGCGTRIIYHGETLQSMEYSPEDSFRLRDVFLSVGIPFVFECDTGMYFDPEGKDCPEIERFRAFAEKHGIAREIRQRDREFRAVKMFCFSSDPGPIREIGRRTAAIGMPYRAIDRGRSGWEMIPKECSKATGIDRLCGALGIDPADCYAFGDSNNDLEMLRHVGHSVAMGNAEDEIKAFCEFVTARPEEDGILKAMLHYGLI